MVGRPGSPSSMQAASSFVHCTRPVSLFRTSMNVVGDRPRPFYPCTVVMLVPRNQLAGWEFMMSEAMTSQPSLIFYMQQTHKAFTKFKMLQHRKFKKGKIQSSYTNIFFTNPVRRSPTVTFRHKIECDLGTRLNLFMREIILHPTIKRQFIVIAGVSL